MTSNIFEFQELKVLAAIVDHGGFQKASEALNLTQSAVSQSLANLERKLGEKLLERTTPVQPTPIGMDLLNHARFILERESEFLDNHAKMKLGQFQKLSVTVDYLVNEYLCHTYVKMLLSKLPEISFRIKRLPAREMIQAVKSGQFDFGIGPFQKNMETLKVHKLFEETSFLVAGRQNRHLELYKENPLAFLRETVYSSRLNKQRVRKHPHLGLLKNWQLKAGLAQSDIHHRSQRCNDGHLLIKCHHFLKFNTQRPWRLVKPKNFNILSVANDSADLHNLTFQSGVFGEIKCFSLLFLTEKIDFLIQNYLQPAL